MSMLKETGMAVSVVALLLFGSHMLLGSDDGRPIPGPTSWLGGVAVPPARFIAKDSITGSVSHASVVSAPFEQVAPRDPSPEQRISSVFAQFMSGGRRPAT